MTDRSNSENSARAAVRSALSRRDVLRMGAAALPAGLMLPAWLTAEAATAPSTFDFYIGPQGSDSNSGTVNAPWAISSLRTASGNFSQLGGKRIGLLPGKYDVSDLMQNDPVVGALQVPGGSSSSPTYLASCDSSGKYSPRTATLDAKGSSGLFGGGVGRGAGVWDGPIIAHTGQYPKNYAVSNLVIDGLVLTGFSYKAIRIGGASSGDGPSGITGVTIQNCELTGGGHNSGDITDNTSAIWIDGCVGAVVSNNYIHNNIGFSAASGDHLNAIICWQSQGTVIQYNTCVNAGSVYGKEVANQGTNVQYNYIDVSMYSVPATAYGIQDFTGANTNGLTQTTNIHHNIVITSGFGIGRATLSDNYGFSTPVNVYNNTIVGKSGAYTALWLTCEDSGVLKVYNNIYTGVGDGSGYKSFLTDPKAPTVWDFNLVKASGMSWALRQNATLSNVIGTYSSTSAFASALSSNGGIGGAESHSVVNDNPGFVGSGSFASAYQLSSSSPAKGAGRTNGTSAGSACDMGAWGNGATQVGCNFAGGAGGTSTVPMAPALTVS